MENSINTQNGTPIKSMTISGNNVAEYVIVCNKESEAELALAQKLADALSSQTGVSLEITNEAVEGAKKILLSLTPDTKKPCYTVKTEGDDLILGGSDEKLLGEAVAYILRVHLGYRLVYVSGDFLEPPETVAIENEDVCVTYNRINKLTLAGRDIADFTITYEAQDKPSVVYAAEELRSFILQATGIALDIEAGAFAGKPQIKLVYNEEMVESFSLKTVDGDLLITGGKRGVLYGVYKFLEKYVGWIFLPTRNALTYEGDTLDIGEIDYSYEQRFDFRAPFWCASSYNAYAARNMVNYKDGRNAYTAQFGDFFGVTGRPYHTFAELLGDPSNEASIRPNPCMYEDGLYERMLAGVYRVLEANPDADIISVSANDSSFCTCDRCTGKDIGGNTTDGLLGLVNRIADAVKVDYPKLKIHTLAYGATQAIPKVNFPRDNVIVQLCAIRCCYQHPFEEECCDANVEIMRDLKEWASVCRNLYIWDYNCDNFYYYATFPNFDVIKKNIKTFSKYNVRGVFGHGNAHHIHGELGDLRAYLLAKLLENPDMTDGEYDSHINSFMKVYYGPGWKHIRAYFDFLMESSNKMSHFGIYAKPEAMYCGDDFIAREAEVDSWFDAAEAAATDDGELLQIRTLRTSYKYIKLFFTYPYVMEHGTEEEKAAKKQESAEAFEELVRENIRLCDVHPPLGIVERDFVVDRTTHPRKWAPSEHKLDGLSDHGMPGSDDDYRRVERSVTGDVIYVNERQS